MSIPVVILAGGTGTRLKEMTEFLPKPLIPVGGIPLVVHVMRWYAKFGYASFVLALGYRQDAFKQFFRHFDDINGDIVVHTGGIYKGANYPDVRDRWDVTLSDTGLNTFKGGRLKRIEKYIEGDTFLCSYGDGIADIDLRALLAFHQNRGKLVTVTGVHPAPRFGEIHHESGNVISFSEKPDGECLINGGFYVFNRGIFDYLTPDEWCDLEKGPLELIAAKGEMAVYEHGGYWGCMDTLRDMGELQTLWDSGRAPWKTW